MPHSAGAQRPTSGEAKRHERRTLGPLVWAWWRTAPNFSGAQRASRSGSLQVEIRRCKKGGQRAMVASSVLSRPGLAARPSQMIGSLKGKGSTSVLEAFAAPSGVSSPFEVKTRLPE